MTSSFPGPSTRDVMSQRFAVAGWRPVFVEILALSEAALTPHKISLAGIRRAGLGGLCSELCGPAHLEPAPLMPHRPTMYGRAPPPTRASHTKYFRFQTSTSRFLDNRITATNYSHLPHQSHPRNTGNESRWAEDRKFKSRIPQPILEYEKRSWSLCCQLLFISEALLAASGLS